MNTATVLNPEEEFVYVSKNLRRNTVRLTVIKSALIDLPSDDEKEDVSDSSSSGSSDRGAAIDSDGENDKPPIFLSQDSIKNNQRGLS